MRRAIVTIGIVATIFGGATLAYQLWWIGWGWGQGFTAGDSVLMTDGAVTRYGWLLFSIHALAVAFVAATLCAGVIGALRLIRR